MKKLHLAFLWHQHQPYYKNLSTGQSSMPWVRLHATKDYYDMAALLDEFPRIRLTINLVPSLIAQLRDYAENNLTDPWLDKTLLPAEQLSEQDKLWILENFFFCNWETMIFPNERYRELLEKKGKFSTKKDLERIKNYFSPQEFTDLQMWFNLAWMDPLLREKDELVKNLYAKARNFSQTDKVELIKKQREVCGWVIQKHKELWQKNQIEISTTPFYHPILPLLCDSDVAEMSMPNFLRPQERLHYPQDARAQIVKGLDYMESVFGRRPTGMWPSEGSVSEDAVAIMAECGVRWAASDEAVLFHSLERMRENAEQRSRLYEPYWVIPSAHPEQKLQMVFRDHGISDSIGFNYSRIPPQKAVDDLIHNLEQTAHSLEGQDGEHLVSIILDGENCWEYYPYDGIEFLRTLYQKLSEHSFIETTTIGQFLENFPSRKTITSLWAGSWINSDFAIWIGDAEDNQAWQHLQVARKFLCETVEKNPELESSELVEQAWESLYIAEGSDWFWWYGDQNSSAHDDHFDLLFRLHIKNIYTLLGQPAPENLNISIKRKEPKGTHYLPVGFIQPKIDGLVSNYYEWKSAGYYQAFALGHTMHVAETVVAAIYYGFSLKQLFFRIDLKRLPTETEQSQLSFKIEFLEPKPFEIQILWEQDAASDKKILKGYWCGEKDKKYPVAEIAFQKNIELALDFDFFGLKPGDPIEFMLLTLKNDIVLESWPNAASIKTSCPSEDFGSDHWSV